MLSRLAQGRSLFLPKLRLLSSAAAKEQSSGQTVSLERRNDVAICRIDIPGASQNVLNERLLQDFVKVVDQIERDDTVKAVVLLSGKPGSFVAGADVNMLKKCKSAEETSNLARNGLSHFERLEKFKKPVVAGIMGSCMGGGLELALSCHYRIAVNDNKTKLALPEVMLGLLPGGGGTQRLPQLVSLQNALDMMLTGKNLTAKKAKKIGLVDQVVEPLGHGLSSSQETTHNYLEQVAVETARKLANGSLKIKREKAKLEKITDTIMRNRFVLDNVVLKMARDKVMKLTAGNYPAPLKILEVIRTGVVNGPSAGYAAESKGFGELSQTNASKALIGLFEGSTDAKKNKYGKGAPVNEVAVIGAGLMGAGIANVTVDKGVHCVLLDANEAGLERGRNQIATVLNTQEKKKKINKLDKERVLSNLVTSLNYDSIKNSDVVIEAVFEDLPLKHKVIKQIESVVGPNTVIATNTSALPIKDIAKASSRPENIIGMHYFSPVDKMQLLEIIVTDQTSKDTLARAAALGLKQGKMVVVVKDCPGFFVVRCLHPMMSEIFRLFQEGVTAPEIDKITKNFGFPVGAATLADEVGLDVAEHVGVFLSGALGPRAGGVDGNLLTDLVKAGFKGRKTGKGIFDYGDGKKGSKKVNEEAVKLLAKYRKEPVASCASTEDRQIRLISRFINEAAICLEEGVISGPSDGDIASVFGIGFPPFWGGPFRFVDLYGANKLVDKMNKYADAYAREQFSPCQLLRDYAKSGKKFYN